MVFSEVPQFFCDYSGLQTVWPFAGKLRPLLGRDFELFNGPNTFVNPFSATGRKQQLKDLEGEVRQLQRGL